MKTGLRIGGFRVLNELAVGSGSQGEVVRAVCEKPTVPGVGVGDIVALKRMAIGDEDSDEREKCERRTRVLAAIDHPNVVKYYGCFVDEGKFASSLVLVMECLSGETLRDLLIANPSGLDADRALMIVREALDGLAAAEAAGVVHRDIKPSNIFICRDGSVKLIDFEISRSATNDATASTGAFVGTFDYMAPEFARETFRGDARSDVFSMGVVLHEALTGAMPYADAKKDGVTADFAFLSRWTARTEGRSAIHVKSSVRHVLSRADEVLAKALAEEPERRFASAAEFRAGLETVCFRELVNGTKVYRLLRVVGKGGFGEVFKARLKSTGEIVAVKHLLKPAYGDRFRREARVMQQVDDPAFVRFIDYFEMQHAGGFEACLVMEFLPGMPGLSLRDAIRRRKGKPLEAQDVLKAFMRYAQALVTLHAQGVYHRDIKPSNLYYPEETPEKSAIMDLGIARDTNGTATVGQVPGTLDYMPPEVVVGGSRGDAGMDIYALGLCLYEAISGRTAYPRLPTGTEAYPAFFGRAKSGEPPVFADAAVEAIPGLRELLQEMTAIDPAKRIQDADRVRQRLAALTIARDARALDEPLTFPTRFVAGPVPPQPRLPIQEPSSRPSKGRLLGIAFALAAVVGVGGAGFWMVYQSEQEKTRLDQAKAELGAKTNRVETVRPAAPKEVVSNSVFADAKVVVSNSVDAIVPIASKEEEQRPQEDSSAPDALETSASTGTVERVTTRAEKLAEEAVAKPREGRAPSRPRPRQSAALPSGNEGVATASETNVAPVVDRVAPKEVVSNSVDAIVSIASPPSPVPSPVPSPTPSPVPSPTPSPVPSPTPSPVPSPTPSPTPPSPTPLPPPAPKSEAVIEAERFVADVRERLQAEPVVGRRDRLQKAHGLINDSRTEVRLAPLGGKVAKELSDLYEAEWECVRGIVANETAHPATIDTGHEAVTLPTGASQMVTFDGTWTSRRYARIEGYEFVMLPHEQEAYEKHVFAIRTPMLVPLPVGVSVPELESGVVCTVSGRAESGVIWTVSGRKVTGTFELYPGEYEVVYEKPDCERQTFPFKVEKGKPLQLRQPEPWKESGIFDKIGDGFTSAVNGVRNIGDEISVTDGGDGRETRENFLMAVELRKKCGGTDR